MAWTKSPMTQSTAGMSSSHLLARASASQPSRAEIGLRSRRPRLRVVRREAALERLRPSQQARV